jgi:hypothetical protein
VLTFVVKVVFGESVEVAVTSLREYIQFIQRFATASSGKFTGRARKFITHLLVHYTFAMWIVLDRATFNLRILAEIGAVVFEA